MAKLSIKPGSTDVSLMVFVADSASTTGGGKTGIAYNASGFSAYYARERAAAAQLTLASLASATAAHADGGWYEIDATNMPGWYRLDLSDAVVAAGVRNVGVQLKGASGMVPCNLEIDLTGEAKVYEYDTGKAPLQPTTVGRTLDVTAGGCAGIDWANVESPTTAVSLSSTTVGVVSYCAALAANSITSSVMASGALASTAFAAGAITASAFATDAITAAAMAATANTEIAQAVRTELATELGRLDAAVSTRLATSGYTAPPTAAAVRGEMDSASTQLAAIKAKTDTLPASPAAVGSAMTLAVAAQQDIAQAIHGQPVYYVSKAGNDSADGLSPDSAKLTIGAAVTAAPSGSRLYVGPGTFTEDVDATGKTMITVHGAGVGVTVIAGEVGGAGIALSDLTAIAVGAAPSGTESVRLTRIHATGVGKDASATITAVTGAVEIRDCWFDKGLWLEDSDTLSLDNVRITGLMTGGFGAGIALGGSCHNHGVLRNVTVALLANATNDAKGIDLSGRYVLMDSAVLITGSATGVRGVQVSSHANQTVAQLSGLTIVTPSSGKDLYVEAANVAAATITASKYDAAKVTGTLSVDTKLAAIETATQDLQTQVGTAGAGLTALPAVSAEIDPEDLTTAIEAAMGAVVFTAEQLAAAPTGSSLDVTLSRVTVGEAPEVNIVAYQGARFGPYTITVEASQQGDSHTLYAFRPGATAAAWTLTTAAGEIAVSGADYKTVTLTDSDAHTGTAETLRYVLRNTTDDTVVCVGTLDIRAAVSA